MTLISLLYLLDLFLKYPFQNYLAYMKEHAPLSDRECHHPNAEGHYQHNKTTNDQVPIETIVWLRSKATLWNSRNSEVDTGNRPALIEELHQNADSHNHIHSTSISLHRDQHRDKADWVFRLRSPPPRQFTLNDVVKAVAPSICSVIIARLSIVLGGCDISTAVTFVTFILIANVGVLILLGISWMCER
ncbi:hypothetical protein DFP73DRAFT_561048 [Morchella snyderi]|nr:hypothetical protein DFP73DRAFT_561048 [Morchella snyderi]